MTPETTTPATSDRPASLDTGGDAVIEAAAEARAAEDDDPNGWLRDSTVDAGPCRGCGAPVTVLQRRVRGGLVCASCWAGEGECVVCGRWARLDGGGTCGCEG